LGNKTELTVGTIEEVTAGAFTEITAGAYSEVTLGQYLDIVLGMVVEVKKGKCVEIGEASRIGISEEEEVIGAKTVSLKAGGESIGVKKAVAAAISLVGTLTSASIAAAKTHKPHLSPRVAVAGSVAAIGALISAITTVYLLKAKMPNQFKSSLEMNKNGTTLKTPDLAMSAKTGMVNVSAKRAMILNSEGTTNLNADGLISLQGRENIVIDSDETTIIKAKKFEADIKETFTVAVGKNGPITLTAQKIELVNPQPGGEVSIKADTLKWTPAAGGQVNFGKLRINAMTGQVQIG